MIRTSAISQLVAGFALSVATLCAATVSAVDFNRDIRPIFSEYCIKCHGRDDNNRQAGFRLDTKESAFARLDSGKVAVLAGDVIHSELFRRVSSTDPEKRMPPKEFGKSLSDRQIELLRRWIVEGAIWQQHWAYMAPVRPGLPKVGQKQWPINDIDYFTLAEMERHSLDPSPPADRERWIRRVTLDLTGLPPTIKEIDDFLADHSRTAHEQVVDRLLKSPRYGERMALHWLDLARYADTHGYHSDSHRDMWRWREWVIDAFNENLTFDQFTIWQIAGDLLPNATLEQKIATGFNRNHMVNFEDGAIADEYRTEYVVDRVVTTSTVWLGQTMLCARCHDHKYDPFTQRDFYRLFAYFNNIPEEGLDGRQGNAKPFIKAPTREQQTQLDRLRTKLAMIERKMLDRSTDAAEDQSAWEKSLVTGKTRTPSPPSDVIIHLPLDETDGTVAHDSGGAKRHGVVKGSVRFSQRGRFGGALLFGGDTHIDLGDTAVFSRTNGFSASAWIFPSTRDEMAILARTDSSKNQRGFEVYLRQGTVYARLVHEWEGNALCVKTKQALQPNNWQHVTMTYDGSQKAAGVQIFVDGKRRDIAIMQDNLNGTIENAKPLQIGRRDKEAPFRGKIDEVRIYGRPLAATEVSLLAGSDPITELVKITPAKRTAAQKQTLRNYYLSELDRPYMKLRVELEDVSDQIDDVDKTVPTVMVMQEMKEPRETFALGRGDYRNKMEKVTAGTPVSLPRLPNDSQPNRLSLARWLVHPSNPLTARVTVNRFWQMYFGAGLSRTPEDFGTRGESPTHPELLDWLATEFVRSGWDVKHIQKLIVMSATYRQSSRLTPELYRRDPQNRLHARGPRFRLQAEFIRDNALFISGLLNEKIGGPSVFPYQPPGLWKEVSVDPGQYTAQVYVQSRGDDLYRRGMYSFWKRAVPPPSMTVFGAPDREVCTAHRPRPNTPLDALVLMNDPTYVQAARALAQRMMKESRSCPKESIAYGFRLATARRPNNSELDIFLEIFEAQLADFRKGNGAALQLLNVDDSPRDESLDLAEFATYTIIANMILNLHETITKG